LTEVEVSELPDNVDLQWIGRHLTEFRDEMRAEMRTLRRDMDMTIRLVTRIDTTLDALREDIRSLWLSHGELRQRIEALEDRK
jgi:hypothetical protein